MEPSLRGLIGIARWLPGVQWWTRPRHHRGCDRSGPCAAEPARQYLRVEPPGIPTAFWRSVGPSHNVLVTESFMDELAAAAKQDPSPIGSRF
jgi:isoquinoline 1-oxidoreductase beta subunit